jgi:CRP/FNR family cyclic AMP-dependent transcriptional regulator
VSRLLTQRRRVSHHQPQGISVHFPAGTKVFDPEHPSRRIYLLNAGRVRWSSGPEAIVDELAPGAFFGEKCFLTPRRSDSAATTLSPVAVTVYRRSELLQGLQRDPLFARRLLKNLALRLDRCEQAIRDFVTEPAERRLARLLSRFTPARPASGWVRLPLRASNVELAQMVGTTRSRVSHFLNHFQRLGWLLRRAEVLWVHREGLHQFLGSTASGGGAQKGARQRSPSNLA